MLAVHPAPSGCEDGPGTNSSIVANWGVIGLCGEMGRRKRCALDAAAALSSPVACASAAPVSASSTSSYGTARSPALSLFAATGTIQ